MKLFYILLFSLLTLSIYGQQTDNRFLVTGSVLDAETGMPLQFVTITLQDTTTKEIIGTITDKKGTFDFLVPEGKYDCIVESLSFKPFIINSIDVCQDYEVGMVELNQNIEELEEVEIVAKSKLMDYKFSKKVYHASKDISNVGGNAITVIENTPTVRISEDGKITIRGNSASVLVNGKPYGGQNTNADILSLIPANSIKNIEILTRSAKYDADGGGEILNIILKKGIVDGYNGTVEVHGGYPDNDGINTFLNYKSEIVNLYTTASFNHSVELKNTNIHQTFLGSDQQPVGNFDEERDDYRQKNNVLFNIGSDFLLNDKNTITASLLFTSANKNYNSEFVMNDYQPVDHLTNSSLRDTKDHTDVTFFESFINYTTKFNNKGHQLSLDMKFSKNRAENNTKILDETIFPDDKTNNKAYKKDELIDTYYFKIDYNYTFKNKAKLIAGHKSNFRKYNNDFIANNFNLVSPLGTPLIGYANNIQYNENVFSLYMNFSQQLEKFSYSFGLRSEFTQTEIISRLRRVINTLIIIISFFHRQP